MSEMASQIISLSIVCSTIYSGADQSKHQSSTSLAFVQGIHRWPVNSPHKKPTTRKMFPFDDVIMKRQLILHTQLIPQWLDDARRQGTIINVIDLVPEYSGFGNWFCSRPMAWRFFEAKRLPIPVARTLSIVPLWMHVYLVVYQNKLQWFENRKWRVPGNVCYDVCVIFCELKHRDFADENVFFSSIRFTMKTTTRSSCNTLGLAVLQMPMRSTFEWRVGPSVLCLSPMFPFKNQDSVSVLMGVNVVVVASS